MIGNDNKKDSQISNDNLVIHPAHYNGEGKLEVWDFIAQYDLNFFLGNAIKYICRAGNKPGVSYEQDLEKAANYILKELENRKNDPNVVSQKDKCKVTLLETTKL